MRRREFIALLSGASVAWPRATRAQQPTLPVIGFLRSASLANAAQLVIGFRRGLKEAGFVEGQNLKTEQRWADAHYDRLPAMAKELVDLKVAAIVTVGGNIAALPAKASTRSTRCARRTVVCVLASHISAGAGKSSVKPRRGKSRSDAPRPVARASCRTRRKTAPLADAAGVLSAATHKGSTSSRRIDSGKAAQSSATVASAAQRKSARCHAAAVRSNESRACQDHRCWPSTPSANASFGGPAGQIAVMHKTLVEEKRWISENRFLHALNYCKLLPGPEAQQLATYIGWLMHRTIGGIVAGGLFIVPGIISIMALSYVYAAYGNVGIVNALFFGLKAAVLAIGRQPEEGKIHARDR